jgi:hypothetical protein
MELNLSRSTIPFNNGDNKMVARKTKLKKNLNQLEMRLVRK